MNLAKISSFSQIVRPCFPIFLLFGFNLLILSMNVSDRISNECIWRNLLAINLIYTNKCSLHVRSLLVATITSYCRKRFSIGLESRKRKTG